MSEGFKLQKFYTRRGDDGTTGVLGEGRLPKYHPVIEAVGAIDEATAALGLARASALGAGSVDILKQIQRDLYNLMSEVVATPDNAPRFRKINSERIAWLEAQTDRLSQGVTLPADFILPGDSASGAACALARTVVRRAERWVTRLAAEYGLENQALLGYLNRLSSLLFVLELWENQAAGNIEHSLAREQR